MSRIPVTSYTLFYEVVDGNLVRYMEPIELRASVAAGSGQPLVLLHSLAGGASTLAGLAAAIGERRRVVSVDLRGFGASHRPTLEYSAATWADDLAALLAELGLEGAAAYGHGFGACAAVEALERGAVTAAAVSGVAFAAGEPAALDSIAAAGDLGEPLAGPLAALTGGPAVAADITSQVVARVARGWQAYTGPRAPASLAGRLLVLAGADDTFTPAGAPGGAAALAAATGAPLTTLPAGHDLPHERPAELADAILDFLDDRR